MTANLRSLATPATYRQGPQAPEVAPRPAQAFGVSDELREVARCIILCDERRPLVEASLEARLVSEANARGHWGGSAGRAKAQRGGAFSALERTPRRLKPIYRHRLAVLLTRCGPRHLDSDNLARAMKATQDGVADWLGRDDGDPALTWLRQQEKSKAYSVRIQIYEVTP